MSYYDRLKRKQLSDILVDEEMSSKEAVITAVHETHQSGRPLSEILISGSELAEYDMVRVLVQHYQLPFLELTHYTYHRDLIDEFKPGFLRDQRLIPLERFGKTVCFAIQEFPNDEVMDKLVEITGGTVFFYAAMATDITEALRENLEGRGEEPRLVFKPTTGAGGVGDEPAPDQKWSELFDTANESIVSNLTATPVKDDDDAPSEDPLGILGGLE